MTWKHALNFSLPIFISNFFTLIEFSDFIVLVIFKQKNIFNLRKINGKYNVKTETFENITNFHWKNQILNWKREAKMRKSISLFENEK